MSVEIYTSPLCGFCPAAKNLLISCGRSTLDRRSMMEAIRSIGDSKRLPFDTVFVEPELMPVSPPSWMKPATFDPGMYNSLKAAIIRPGVGTITDALAGETWIYAFDHSSNMEMKHNMEVVCEHGFGKSFSNLEDAFLTLLADLSSGELDSEYPAIPSGCSGDIEAATLIASMRQLTGIPD